MRVKKASTKEKSFKLLSLLLSLCMIVGLLPTAIFAATDSTVLDAAIFCSDVHGSTSDLTSVLKGVKTSGADYSSIGFVGDTCLTVANTTSTVQSALGDTDIDVMFSYASSHDTENSADIQTNWDYSGEVENVSNYYLVYTIRETDMQNNNASEADFTTWYNGLTDAQKKLPIFIMSHRPLHARRNDNANAADWYKVISAAAESSDIVFFWAHNHTSENDVDTAAYYVAKDGTEEFTVYNGDTVVPNFTYMNAGYINANGQNPARKGIATTVQITTDSLIFQDYNSSGAYSGTYAHNVTVDREFAVSEPAVTLESIDVSGTTEYTLGGNGLELTVTATYDDGTTADVTSDATFEPAELTASGTYTVTASYGGMTDSIDVIVAVYDEDDNNVMGVQAVSQGATALTVTWDDSADEILENAGVFSDYVVYDLALTNYSANTETEYSMFLVEDMDTADLAVYHVAEDGTLTSVPFVIEGDCVVFTTTLTGTFAYGVITVPEGYVLDSITVSNAPEEFFVGESLNLTGDFTVTAIYKKDGAEDFTRVILPYEENNNPDGYTVDMNSFDMTAAGTYHVKIDYSGVSATFAINVWDEEFVDSATGVIVHVGEDEYGVTAASVTEIDSEEVTTAITEHLQSGSYKAYDIDLNFADSYETTTTAKTVTLPIPDGVTNPAVFFVSDDKKTITDMNATKSEDGTKVIFTTDHFSTYVVGESTEIKVPDNETASGSGTIGGKENLEVYMLTSSISTGNEYLIADTNSAGSANLLANNSGSVSNTTATVVNDSNGTYIVLTDAADELWTYDTVESGNGYWSEEYYTFKNGSHYLYYTSSGYSYTLNLTTSTPGRSWSYSDGQLTIRSRYLTGGSSWSLSSSESNVYFYVKTTIEVDTTTTVTGTYSIEGKDETVVVSEGSTWDLESSLIFTSESGTATTTDTSTTATYTVVEGGDPNGIISSISGNTVTFSGNYGKALVMVSYDVKFDDGTKTVTDYITITASAPYYTIDLHKQATDADGKPIAGAEITQTIAIKGVVEGQTYSVWAIVKEYDGVLDDNGEDGADLGDVEDNMIEWTSSDKTIATVDPATGVITFTGKDGTVDITATYLGSNKPADTIKLSVTQSLYTVPEDGTDDFPEYPNEGAIRYDKTATAVGNFSETGIVQVELSMTGVPYTTGSELDVVLMLDITGSMHDKTASSYTYSQYVRVEATIIAAKAFVESIVVNEDGSYNENRVGIYSFNSGGTYTLLDLGTISSDSELEAAYGKIERFNDDYQSGGTPYDDGLSKVQSVLSAAKTDGIGNDRQQFAIFMSDGVPTSYAYVNGTTYGTYSSASAIAGMLTSSDNYQTRDTDYKYEYYSTEMKKAGVTVYTVGLGLENTNSAWSGGTATQCLNLASRLLNDISGPANEATQPDAVGTSTLSKQDTYFFSVEDATAATDMENVFANIALQILQAATDVTVGDQISDDYTMIFDIPEGTQDITGVTNDFYIEFVKYTLDANHERTDDGTSITKLYLKNTNDVYSAAKDSSGTAYDAPVFEAKTIGDKGTLYYWTTDANYASKAAVSYSDGTNTYYFIPDGMKATDEGFESGKWFNMTSGGYASGTVDSTTNMSDNLVIVTPYFVYNAGSKMLYWTVDKLDTTEYALRYFLYLDNSATEVGTDSEVPPAAYETNQIATLTYTNFNGEECRQEFPVPQMTWSGAQVSYVFYLVNSAGQPINKSGQIVDFANATFVTDTYTVSTVWNKGADGQITADSQLSVDWLADELLPSDYAVYDEKAGYALHVYGDHTGESIFDYFIISGETAANISSSLNSRLTLNTTASTVSVETTKVYNTKAGVKYDDYGTYTSKSTDDVVGETVLESFDFYNTTVAFAVVWEPKLVPDVVVVDYGLDVLIDVVQNDFQQNAISGIGLGTSAYGSVAMNTGISSDSKLGTAGLTIDGNTVSIENGTQIRFHQGDMSFAAPVTFYYESPAAFWENSQKKEGYMYSSVTVIPATTIYYEDSFLTLESYSKGDDGNFTEDETSAWTTEGTVVSDTQAQDRPGKSQISAALDADNNYGYDAAYKTMATHSLGSGAKFTANASARGEASFTFWGTGFDVIGLTSNATGTLIVQVYSGSSASGTAQKSLVVDTYYGMEEDGTLSVNNPDTLYQVPVMKISGLDYGQYTAKIIAGYNSYFDHTNDNLAEGATDDTSYDLYLDAIRIYDPTGNQNTEANNAYVADGEGWPTYQELRNNIIAASNYTVTENEDGTVTVTGTNLSGAIFIDCNDANYSIADYVSYGPNNELYLAAGQSIAFNLTQVSNLADVQIGLKVGNGNSVSYEIYNAAADGTKTNSKTATLTTSTDMYYSIKELASGTIVITNTNTSGGILSITNIKTTYTQNPYGTSGSADVVDDEDSGIMTTSLYMDELGATAALMSLRTVSVEEDTTPDTEETPDADVPEQEQPKPGKDKPAKPEKPDNPNKGPQNNSGNHKNNGKNNKWNDNRSNGHYF